MSQILQSARIVNTIAEMQKTLESLNSALYEMRLAGADEGLLQVACEALANCEPILSHNIGEVLGHDDLMDALDAMQLDHEFDMSGVCS